MQAIAVKFNFNLAKLTCKPIGHIMHELCIQPKTGIRHQHQCLQAITEHTYHNMLPCMMKSTPAQHVAARPAISLTSFKVPAIAQGDTGCNKGLVLFNQCSQMLLAG